MRNLLIPLVFISFLPGFAACKQAKLTGRVSSKVDSKVTQPSQQFSKGNSSINIPEGSYSEVVNIVVEEVPTEAVKEKIPEDKEIVSDTISMKTTKGDGLSLCDTEIKSSNDIQVQFKIKRPPEVEKLEGVVIACAGTPKEQMIKISFDKLTIASIDDQTINVSFTTREPNGLFFLIYDKKVIGDPDFLSKATGVYPGSVSNPRVYFQSRSTIDLQFGNELFEQAGTLNVKNLTANISLLENQAIEARLQSSLALSNGQFDANSLSLKFAPIAFLSEELFKYGENQIKASVNRDYSGVEAQKSLTILDSDVFVFSASRFDSPVQVKENFQGWMGGDGRSLENSGQGALMSTFGSMINE